MMLQQSLTAAAELVQKDHDFDVKEILNGTQHGSSIVVYWISSQLPFDLKPG